VPISTAYCRLIWIFYANASISTAEKQLIIIA